jgi:hypothetical protein
MQNQSEFEQYLAICKRVYDHLMESGSWRIHTYPPPTLPS